MNIILNIAAGMVANYYLKSKFHFDDGTINAIMKTVSFYVRSVHIQLQSFVDKDEQLHSPSSVLNIL